MSMPKSAHQIAGQREWKFQPSHFFSLHWTMQFEKIFRNFMRFSTGCFPLFTLAWSCKLFWLNFQLIFAWNRFHFQFKLLNSSNPVPNKKKIGFPFLRVALFQKDSNHENSHRLKSSRIIFEPHINWINSIICWSSCFWYGVAVAAVATAVKFRIEWNV